MASFSSFGNQSQVSETNEPKLFPQEEVYLRLQNGKITYEDDRYVFKLQLFHNIWRAFLSADDTTNKIT